MGKKKIAAPIIPVGTEYTDYVYAEVSSGMSISGVIGTLNTNLGQYNTPPLTTIETRLDELKEDLSRLAFSGEAVDVVEDTSHKFITDVQIPGWDEISETKIVYDSEDSTVYRNIPGGLPEDITLDFRYGAGGYPYMKDLVNDGPPRDSGQPANPYLTLRDVFAIYNVTVDSYEENTLGDDYEYFNYTAVVDLTNHLYDGTNLNSCIYYHECEEIENYTALVCLTQGSADMVSINKISRTSFENGKATVQFNTTFPSGTVNINSILFIHKDRNQLTSDYTAMDFLESSGSPYMATGITSSWIGQLGVVFTGFNGTGTNAIFGNGDYLGIKYNSTDDVWQWVYHYGGTDNIDTTSNVALSTYYHIEIIHEGSNKKIFANGNNIITVPIATDDTSEIYLFANNSSGSAVNFSTIKLYPIKIFGDGSDRLLKGDYVPCSKNDVAHLYNLADKSVLDKAGSGTIVGGYDPDISDYIILGSRVPNNITRGHVNQFYRVRGTNDYYQCLGYSLSTGYIWKYSLLSLTIGDIT